MTLHHQDWRAPFPAACPKGGLNSNQTRFVTFANSGSGGDDSCCYHHSCHYCSVKDTKEQQSVFIRSSSPFIGDWYTKDRMRLRWRKMFQLVAIVTGVAYMSALIYSSTANNGKIIVMKTNG